MSLNWTLTKVKDYEEVCFYTAPKDVPMDDVKAGDRVMRPATWALITATMVIGIGNWTKENIDEVFIRIRQYERSLGPLLYVPQDTTAALAAGSIFPDTLDGKFISYAEICRHVGLSTNVFPTNTKAQWSKHLDTLSRRDREAEIRYAKEKQHGA